MSTESGNNSRAGANDSDRLAPADETQVLPTGETPPAHPAGAATAGSTAAADDDGSTRALPLSHTKDPHADYADAEYSPDAGNTGTGVTRPSGTARPGASDGARTGGNAARGVRTGSALPEKANREARLALEKERFGGMKFGAAFFGWLTATGMVVLLSALAAAIGAAVDFSTDNDLGQSLDQAMANQSAGIIGTVILLVILLLAYFAGGYVAGRMARFNGFKQGLAVWLWALIAGVAVVVLGLIFGDDIRSISQLNTVAPLPEDLDGANAATWIAVAATLAATLVGALLGGLAGMRYHRRIDRADFSDTEIRA